MNPVSCKSVPHYSDMAHRGNVDLISNMPSEIIEKILTHLQPRQAVRTSVLARSWRYRWTSMPDLNFAYMDGGWGTSASLVKGVNGCLHRHRGPIRKFGVRASTLTVRHKLHQWMCLVLKPDLEELQVDVWGDEDRFPYHLLFSCKKLTSLKLSGIKLLIPSAFEGFLNLKILDLSYEKVDNKIGMLISKCPLLESLTLFSAKSSNDMITIYAPKVKYFKLQGKFKNICLENANMLVDMIIDLFSNERQCNVIKFIGGAPNLERLTYFTENFKFGLYRGVLSTTFNYLKLLELADVDLCEMDGIPVLIELITSAPNLEKLVIKPRKSYPSKPKVKSSFWQKEYPPGNGFMKLKVIKMLDILCVAHEFEFATFMLLNSPILEKMELRSTERKDAVIKRVYKKLPKLPQASPRAVVTFHPYDSKCVIPFLR